MPQLDPRWRLAADAGSLAREIVFKNFARAMAFLNRLASVAEQEGHHPDFCLRGWNRVTVTLRTHAIGGLSLNDFILAAKLDQVVKPPAEIRA
jgi:4a-hydroxytetrahydrobiopterin dehydratase